MKLYPKYLKNLFDFIFSFVGIIILFPVLILASICLLIANNGKIFFIQKRPGKNGKIFKILKFKTMNDKRDAQGALLSDRDRLTPVGIFIRKTSIDEIPQLINVLKGDMSLIGPRPLLPEYLPLYNDFQKQRHDVKPGITGWAQVNGRNAIAWSQKFEYDVWYVKNVSFILDFNIIIKTIQKVIQKDGINAANNATIDLFNGED